VFRFLLEPRADADALTEAGRNAAKLTIAAIL
jgi:hypothetical protein